VEQGNDECNTRRANSKVADDVKKEDNEKPDKHETGVDLVLKKDDLLLLLIAQCQK